MWDERYRADFYVFGTEPNDFLEQHLGELRKGEVLCLAEGEGRNAVFLAREGFKVTAVDASPVGLAKARRLAKEHGVEIQTVCADLEDYDMGVERWDSIVSIFCHVLPPLRKKVHARVRGALRKGGVFLLEAYTPAQLTHGTGGPKSAERMMSKALLREELAGLRFLRLEELEREILEGVHHTGRSAVVQLIAEKAA